MKPMDGPMTFQMRNIDNFLVEVDAWRREQKVIPSRAEAIRYLVRKGLEVELENPKQVENG